MTCGEAIYQYTIGTPPSDAAALPLLTLSLTPCTCLAIAACCELIHSSPSLCLQIRAVGERIAELRAAHEAQVGAVLGQYQGLRAAVQQYHAEMEGAMAMQPSSVQAY